MTNYLAGTHAATGAATGRMDAGAGNTFGVFNLRVVSPSNTSVVALETSPDNSTFTEVCRCTGDGWAFAGSNHRQRYARVNIINMGGAGGIASNVCSYP
jgi:hypothetical protein